MNALEKEMSVILKELKDNYDVSHIKAEFEAEASRIVELSRLKDVTSSIGLPLIFKIGGVEAITDIYECLTIGVAGIVAPMAETPFAMLKFVKAIVNFIPEDNQKEIEFGANIETITAYKNIDEILKIENINLLSILIVGRVDFSASMGLDRKTVNNEKMLEICKNIFEKVKTKGLKTGLGGAVSIDSIQFLKKLNEEKLLDRFETRKVVFKNTALDKDIEKGIMKAVKFELLWLKSKKRYYSRANIEDDARIKMLEERLK